ncbi:fluoride efflux transporter CrcB [Microterricola viridarii]|uniref:Fluoride-specific ion channel FluC n=1 Tax=Microterricola viridarii TaxID=412690 RepID=A0A0X8E3U5_9MICO|nr:fluoride efflux transporter CrcB [Microterricola viridarii]AMB58903.1 chromosome condensation protein CrcB [Microterricola viridarii]
MTPLIFLLLAVAGGVGAGVRFLVDGLIRARLKTAFPWATTIINASGSLVLGFLTGLTLVHVLPSDLSIILGTGFLGGYTTFSTASYETVQLIKQGRLGAAFTSGVVMLVLCVALAALGLWWGSSI